MKNTMLSLLFLFGICISASAQLGTASNTIAVSGEATVQVDPDEVVIRLGVETWGETIQKARTQSDDVMSTAINTAKQFGIESKYIQTDHINVQPTYAEDLENKVMDGIIVRKSLVITLKELSRFEDLLTALLSTGINHIKGIEFRTTELRKYRDQARSLAVVAAREKAEAMAGDAGTSIGNVLSIREDRIHSWDWYNSYWGSSWSRGMTQNVIQSMDSGSQSTGSVSPGQISVDARVSVSFALVN